MGLTVREDVETVYLPIFIQIVVQAQNPQQLLHVHFGGNGAIME